jgi:hypothetical protein
MKMSVQQQMKNASCEYAIQKRTQKSAAYSPCSLTNSAMQPRISRHLLCHSSSWQSLKRSAIKAFLSISVLSCPTSQPNPAAPPAKPTCEGANGASLPKTVSSSDSVAAAAWDENRSLRRCARAKGGRRRR